MFPQRVFYDFVMCSQQLFVCCCLLLILYLKTKRHFPPTGILPADASASASPSASASGGEDAHTVPTDGGGKVFGGAAMTRRKRLR